MEVIYELDAQQIEQLYQLYQYEWWTKDRTFKEIDECIKGSQLCVGLIDHHANLQAFARVLTDFTLKALIFDLIVSEAYRGKGLGSQIISLIKNHEKLKKVKHFELYCLPAMYSFYEKHGFTKETGNIKLMRFINTQ